MPCVFFKITLILVGKNHMVNKLCQVIWTRCLRPFWTVNAKNWTPDPGLVGTRTCVYIVHLLLWPHRFSHWLLAHSQRRWDQSNLTLCWFLPIRMDPDLTYYVCFCHVNYVLKHGFVKRLQFCCSVKRKVLSIFFYDMKGRIRNPLQREKL